MMMDSKMVKTKLFLLFNGWAGDISNVPRRKANESENGFLWLSHNILWGIQWTHPLSKGDDYLLSPHTYLSLIIFNIFNLINA